MPCCGISPDRNSTATRAFVLCLGLLLSLLALVRPGYGALARNAYAYVFKGTSLERRAKCRLAGRLMPRFPRLAGWLYRGFEVNFLRLSTLALILALAAARGLAAAAW